MSLYPVSNFNIGTGVATEVLDSISSADGTLVVTFSNGVATFTNPITGTITNANNIQITSDNSSFGNYALVFVKTNSGYQPVYVANATIYINPTSGTLFATTINASTQIVVGTNAYWDAGSLNLGNGAINGAKLLNLTDQANASNYWQISSYTSLMYFDYNGVTKMTLSNNGLGIVYGTQAGLAIESRDITSTDFWVISVSGPNTATTYALGSTSGGNNVLTLTDYGLQTLNGASAGLTLNDRITPANKWTIYSTSNAFTFDYAGTPVFNISTAGVASLPLSVSRLNTTAGAGTLYYLPMVLSGTTANSQQVFVDNGMSYNATTNTLTVIATKATNLNGASGVPYQSAAATTSYLVPAAANEGYVIASGGASPAIPVFFPMAGLNVYTATFAAVSTLDSPLNVFTTSLGAQNYKSFRISLEITSATGTNSNLRFALRTSTGTINASSWVDYNQDLHNSGLTTNNASAQASCFCGLINTGTFFPWTADYIITNPAKVLKKQFSSTLLSFDNTGTLYTNIIQSYFNANTALPSFRFTCSTGTITGNITVYTWN